MYVTPQGDIACKVVLFGCVGAGRSTFIAALHKHFPPSQTTDIEELDLDGEQAQGFIWRSGKQVQVQGRSLVVTVMTLSGRSRFSQARRALVAATDGVIFVADTRRQHLDENIDAMNDLMDHLRAHQLPEQLPMVIAYNRQDDPAALPVRQLDPLLNHFSAPSMETAANIGRGVEAVWLAITGILVPEAEGALHTLPEGPEPSLQQSSHSGWLLSCHACGAMLEVESAAPGDVFNCGACGASIQVIDPETGHTGPVGGAAGSATASSGANSQAYGLQSLPQQPDHGEALSPSASSTGPISAAKPFELSGFDLLKELDVSPLGQRFRLYERAKQRKVRVFRIDQAVVASPGYRVQIDPYVRMASKVTHPNLVAIVALRWQGNRPYLISEDAPNTETLTTVLSRRRTFSALQAIEIIQQVALGLEEAARHGVVHGFLRPDVILLGGDGRVQIDGMGVPKAHAHLIQSLEGQSPSTEYYLAPEHLLVDAPSDIRSDMFLLGAVLYRMVSAEGLVTGYNAVEALHRFNATGMGTIAATSETLPRELVTLLARLTAVDRRERFQHYGEAIENIERVLGILQRSTMGRGKTGQTASRRRSGNGRATGAIRQPTDQYRSGTGPLRSSTGTGGIRRPATGAQARPTGTVRGTAAVARGRGGETPYTQSVGRRRGRRNGLSAGNLVFIMVLVLMALGVIGFVVINNQRAPIRVAPDPAIADRDAQQRSTAQPSPEIRARRAVERYQQSPGDDGLYRAAEAALSEISGERRAALEARLRSARDEHRRASQTETATAARETASTGDPDGAAAEPQRSTEAPAEVTGTATQLSARQQAALSDLRRQQRYGQALAMVRSTLAPGETRDFLREDIRAEYEQMKEATKRRVATAESQAELRRLLTPARELWQMEEGDVTWADELIAQAADTLPERSPAMTAAAEGGPATSGPAANGDADSGDRTAAADTPPPVGTFALPETSPGGFTTEEISIDSRIVEMLRNPPVNRDELRRALSQLPEGSSAAPAIGLRESLHFKRGAAVAAAVAKQARLRVTNPIAGGLWDVNSASDDGLVISSPTGSSMSLRWSDMSNDEVGRLAQQLSRVNNLGAEHLAVATVLSLNHGHRTQATLLARQAREGGWAEAELLDRLLLLDRDRGIMSRISKGVDAQRQLDPFLLAEVIDSLEKLSGPREPLVAEAITHFKAGREAILAGTAGGSQQQGRDDLSFDDPDDRLAFERRGWMIGGGAYTSRADSASLSREDLGNAESLHLDYSLENRDGRFRVNFRGVEVIAEPNGRHVRIRAEGSTSEQRVEVALATQTVYHLAMKFDPLRMQMQVTLNRLDPVAVPMPRATPRLSVTTEGGAGLALQRMTIKRLGQTQASSPESLAQKQEALRGLGLIPYGRTVKDPDSPAIIIPEGEQRSGLGIPLSEGDNGVRFRVSGSGQMLVRIGTRDQATAGNFTSIDVSPLGGESTLVEIRRSDGQWEMNVTYPDGQPLLGDYELPAGADTVVIMAEKMLTIHSTPEALR